MLTAAGTAQALFLDGQQVGTVSGMVPGWRQYATVGSGIADSAVSPAVPVGSATFPFQGVIDEVAVYDKPLTSAEIAAHYQARNAAPYKLTKVTLPSGRVWAINTYDDKTDRLATHIDDNGGTWKIGDLSINHQYGEAQVTVADPDNQNLAYLYDAWRGFRIRGETDQFGYTTWSEYDQAGFLTKVIDRNDIANEIYQDKRGNTLGRQYCRAAGECAIEFWSYYLNTGNQFDPRNDRVIAYRDGRSAGDTDNTYATTVEYNSFGEQTKQTGAAVPGFPSGRSTSITYTDGTEPAVGGGTIPAGLVKTKTDARGSAWSYRYTAAGDLAEQTEPEGLITKLDYDTLGRLTASTRISAAMPEGAKTTFTYDGLSRIATTTSPATKNEVTGVTHTGQTRYTYDSDSNVLTQTLADLTGGDPDRTTGYSYDTNGRLATATDPEGGITRQEWNQRGWLTRTTDPRGTIIDTGFSKRGELTSRTLKGWTGSPVTPQPARDVVLESRGYDPGGRLTTAVDAMGRKTSLVYWMDHQVKQKTATGAKLNGSTAPRDVEQEADTYDPAGNLVEQVTGGIAKTVSNFDAASQLTSRILDPGRLARTTAYVYDANGNITQTTLTAAGISRSETKQYRYNKANQPTKETVEKGAQDLISTIGYDERGLVTSITDPRGNDSGANPADFTTTLRYDALDQLVETLSPTVKVDKAGTASDVRPSSRLGYDTVSNKTQQTDPEGRTTTYSYDKAGRLTQQAAPGYTPPGGSPLTPTVKYTYDAAGLLTGTTNERGFTAAFDYDQLGRQVRATDPAIGGQSPGTRVTEYDLVGEKLATVDQTGARSEATYDDLGRQITATQIERKPSSAAYTTSLEYDDLGRLTKKTLPGNKTTSYTVNVAGEVTETTDTLSHTTTLAYDLAGRLNKTTDPLGNATTADYDLAGRQTGTKDLDSTGAVLRTFGYGYDSAGNKISTTSPEGRITRQSFDALSRLTSLIEPVSDTESITTSFGYDAAGARTRLTDGRGNATWTTYNSLGGPETVTEPSTTAHPTLADRTWTYLYDAASNQTSVIQPGGVRIDRTFDPLDRLTHEDGAGGGAATAQHAYGYDLAGRRTQIGNLTLDYNDRSLTTKISQGATQQTAYTYDALGNPTQRVDAAGTATFTWDNANRLATATDPVTNRTLTYGYDTADRLKTITATSGQASTQTLGYDNLDRVTSHTLTNGAGTQLAKITYGWDKDNNLTTKTTSGLAGAGTNTYGYDYAGRLISWKAANGTTSAYTWDAAGNRTKAGTKTYIYDERNRLTSGDDTNYTYSPRGTLASQTKSGTTTQLTFDAFDRLIADGDSLYAYDDLDRVTFRTKGTTKTLFAYTGTSNDLAALTDTSGAVQAKYAHSTDGSLIGLQEGTGAAVATMTDLHDDVVATYTSALSTSTAYDPFGAITAQTGIKTNLGYQSGYTDPDTGNVNMAARWYQPSTGTFTSRDTATLNPNPSAQANRYAYANASPLTGTDPTGHSTVYTGGTAPLGGQTSSGPYLSDNSCSTFNCGGGGAPSSGGSGYYRIGDACETFNGCNPRVTTLDGILVMTKDQMKARGTLPNGMTPPPGFWDAPKKVIDKIIAKTYAGASELEIALTWMKYQPERAASSARGPDNGPTQEIQACENAGHTTKYCIGRVADEKKWLRAYSQAIQDVSKKYGYDVIHRALASKDGLQRELFLGQIDKRFCAIVGGSCVQPYSFVLSRTVAITIVIRNANDDKAREAAETVAKAVKRVMAKGPDYVLRTLRDAEYADYSALINSGNFGGARRYFGTALHRSTALELDNMSEGRFRYFDAGEVDLLDQHNNVRVELTTERAFDEHLNRANTNYRLASYVLYRIGALPLRAEEITRGAGHEE